MTRTIVYDLDGTLCSKNTFKIFLFSSTIFYLFTFQISNFFRVIKIFYKRIKGDFSRWDMKKELANVFIKSKFLNIIKAIISHLIKKNLRLNLIEDYTKKGDNIILATAALEAYILDLFKTLNFSHLICTTNIDIENDMECLAEIKRNRLEDFLNGTPIDMFFTDHFDDLPTIKISNKTFLVNPSVKSINLIYPQTNENEIEIIKV